MQLLRFRSLNALIDTSSLERRAFNTAFKESGLDWRWTEDEFTRLKLITGERHRIAWYAENCRNCPISSGYADQILWRKEQSLTRLLQRSCAKPQPGVLRLIDEAMSADIHTGIVAPRYKEWERFSRTISQFKALSTLQVERSPVIRARADRGCPTSIEVGITTPIGLHEGPLQPCINVWSSVSGASACVTHLGETNNPAVQLSGQGILEKGRASLQSLLWLESSHKELLTSL